MPRRSVLCVAATTIILALAGIGEAEDKGEFTLTAADPGSPGSTATWSGEFVLAASPDVVSGALATVPALPVSPLDATLPPCDASLCDVAKLGVALAPGAWTEDGGMLIQIQWPLIDAGYDLDLFVYGPDGSLVAQSAVWAFSRTESVWIRNPANGIYTAVIEPSLVVSQPIAPDVLTPLDYDAFVGFERALTVTRQETNNGEPYTRSFVVPGLPPDAPPVTLLPDLVPTTPTNFHIESAWGAQYYLYGDRGLDHQPSCYPLETAGLTADDPTTADHPLKCLRWDQGEYNFGDGPFELHIYPDQGTGTDVYQRVYASDGSAAQYGPLGKVIFSQAHGHFHYLGWQEVDVYHLNDDGTLGPFVGTAADKGICMVDIENARFGQVVETNSPLGYPVPGSCDNPTHSDPNDPTFPGARYLQMGISVGYADLYPWFIADQAIDITAVPDGRYAIVVHQDVSGLVHEKTIDNDTAMGCVEIAGDQATEILCTP